MDNASCIDRFASDRYCSPLNRSAHNSSLVSTIKCLIDKAKNEKKYEGALLKSTVKSIEAMNAMLNVGLENYIGYEEL